MTIFSLQALFGWVLTSRPADAPSIATWPARDMAAPDDREMHRRDYLLDLMELQPTAFSSEETLRDMAVFISRRC